MKAPKATDDDDWATAATDHDSLVVEMLLQLKYSTRHQASATRASSGKLVPNLGWGVKQPRSASAVSGSKSKEQIGRRFSPSTPLSWSGGSGGGDGVEGCDASSLRTNRSPISTSKINLDGGGFNGASSSKLRKKKTYAELAEEEEMLIKESVCLNQELVVLGGTVKEQRVENENLKRIKHNLITMLTKNNTCTAAGTIGSRDATSRRAVMEAELAEVYDCIPSTSRPKASSKCCKTECDMSPAQKRANIMLPDLNMMPPELDSTT